MRKYLIILILASIGIFNAAYLSIHAYQYWDGADASALQSLPCDISSKLSCSGILQNPRAIIFEFGGEYANCPSDEDCITYSKEPFKVAFPMIALVVYPLLFLLALSGYIHKSLTEAKILTILALGGMCFNGYVISQEIIVGIFCPLCAMCTMIIVTIFILAIRIWKYTHLNVKQ